MMHVLPLRPNAQGADGGAVVAHHDISDWIGAADATQLALLPVRRHRLGADQLEVEGSGLGLSIARATANAMDGLLEARSELGMGSTFTLRLPLAAGD